jgi:hypothetical protein
VHGPFTSIEDAQAAVDAWRKQYNTDRPHQSLAMGFPSARFTGATSDVLGLRIPADLTQPVRSAQLDDEPARPTPAGQALTRAVQSCTFPMEST